MMAQLLAFRTPVQKDKPRDRQLRNVIIVGNAIAWALIVMLVRVLS